MKSILLTRPYLDSLITKCELQKYGHKIFIEPIFDVEYLTPDLSTYNFDTVIASSKNGVKAFKEIHADKNVPIITVGNATKQCAEDVGFSNIMSADSNVEGLVSYITSSYAANTQTFLYIRGEEVTMDLKTALCNEGYDVNEVVVYKTVPKTDITEENKELLLNGDINAIAFFSSQTARIFCTLAQNAGLTESLNKVTAYAMSKNIAKNLTQMKWKEILSANVPTQESLIEIINET